MAMLETAEIRWFSKGSAPDAVADWFVDGLDLAIEDRIDRYLVLPGSESVGVKLRDVGPGRETRFEVKAIQRAPEMVTLANEVAGRWDTWVKWSTPSGEFDPADRWVAVRKRRLLRRFSMERDTLREVPVLADLTSACTIELVDLDTTDGAWWTIGFESYGTDTDLGSQLHAVATAWFDGRPPPAPLRVADSIAYPTWIAALER